MNDLKEDPAGGKFCRGCLGSTDLVVDDIFKDKEVTMLFPGQSDKEVTTLTVAEQIYNMFQIKYEDNELYPRSLCAECLGTLQRFTNYQKLFVEVEEKMQKQIQIMESEKRLEVPWKQCPGLNGNPGVFVPEDDATIIVVDPNQEYESSDDEFSMESDMESDETSPIKITSPSAQQSVKVQVEREPLSMDHVSMSTNPATTADAFASNGQNNIKSTVADDLQPVIDYTPKNTFLCQYCDMAFTAQVDCTNHESRHDANTPYSCNFCQYRTASRQNLINHIKHTHSPERPYICGLCNKGFVRRSDLKKHTIVHTGVRPYTCHVCGKSFSRNTNLTKHVRIHTSDRPHVCSQCPRSFTSAIELTRHIRTHNEIKSFQCNRCPASFSRRDKMQLHEQSHIRQSQSVASGEHLTSVTAGRIENMAVPLNPFNEQDSLPADDPYRNSILAAQLQRPFAGKIAATSRQRLHICDICNKQFTRERDLQRHQALHLDKLFTCKQCGASFNRSEKLARHEQEHYTVKYPCEICHVTFYTQDVLEQHRKMHEQMTGSATGVAASASAANLPPQSGDQPSAEDMSFYSRMVPMNLGFYNERPEDRNGI